MSRGKKKARVRKHIPGVMNGLETRYAEELEQQKQRGEIHSYRFEEIRLVLAKRTTYMPDFFVVDKDGMAGFHEVKGHWMGTGRVKIKVAAAQFPEFSFIAIQEEAKKRGGGWKYEEF